MHQGRDLGGEKNSLCNRNFQLIPLMFILNSSQIDGRHDLLLLGEQIWDTVFIFPLSGIQYFLCLFYLDVFLENKLLVLNLEYLQHLLQDLELVLQLK